MGTLLGHVMSGTFMLVMGLWWTYNIWERYFTARQAQRRFLVNVSFPLKRSSRVSWESLLVMLLATVGIVAELVTGWRDGELAEMGNGQHATMYMMFVLCEAAEAARVAGLVLVPGLEYAVGAMAFAAEAVLFVFHGNGTSKMEMMVHHLLLYVVVGCAVSTLVEMVHRHSVAPALARAFFTLLQGTWLIQVGLILYPPSNWPVWDINSHRQQKLATMVFVWHWAAVVVGMAVIGGLLKSRTRAGIVRVASGGSSHHQRDKLLPSSEDEP